MAPFVVIYTIFSLYPLITTFIYSTSNMKPTTAAFWEFDHKDVYYDRYLDLTEYYSDNFDERTGVDLTSYKRIRCYFDKFQKNADKFNPLKKAGIDAIVEYANNPADNDANAYSVEASNAVMAAYNEQDFSPIIPYYDELLNWYNNYSNETLSNRGTINSIMRSAEDILNSGSAGEDGESESNTLVDTDILESDSFVNFVDSLKNTEFNEAQVALLDYLSSYVSEQLGKQYTMSVYFEDIKAGSIKLDDPTVYYTCYRLSKTNIDFANENEDTLLGDMKILNEAGIVDLTQLLFLLCSIFKIHSVKCKYFFYGGKLI